MSAYARYPARITAKRADGTEVGTWVRSALVVKDGRARAGAFVQNQRSLGVEVILDRPGLVEVEVTISRQVVLHFDDGETWTVDKGDGCSCHNELQRWYTKERGRPARSGTS